MQTTIRAAKGLLNSGLVDPKSVSDSSLQEKIKALNSEGNVQRGAAQSWNSDYIVNQGSTVKCRHRVILDCALWHKFREIGSAPFRDRSHHSSKHKFLVTALRLGY